MNAVTAGICSAPIAAVSTNTKMIQKTTFPMPADGDAPGNTRSTYWFASDSCRALSRPAFSATFWTTFATTLAMK